MKRTRGDKGVAALGMVLVLFQAPGVWASSVRMSYRFTPGSVYRVTEKNHDVGKTVTEMNVMGQPQKFETDSDQVSTGTWTAEATGRRGEGVVLAVRYGQHKGGQRWSSDKIQSGDMFANSSAQVVVHPTEGLVDITAKPEGDATVELIYRSRFAWMPSLPKGFMKKGDSFTHEYVMKSGMYNVKTTDEYYLVEVKENYATFDVETKQLMVVKMNQAPGGAAMPGMAMSDMKLAYRGEGSAVFDVKEGIFIEREGKLAYSNLDSSEGAAGQMAFKSRMEGVMQYMWEMERQ